MLKTRVLPRYLGESGDLKYNTTGYICNAADINKPANAYLKSMFGPTLLLRYSEGAAQATSTLSWTTTYNGEEVFDSSENRRPVFNNLVHRKNRLVNVPYALAYQLISGMYFGTRYYRRVPTVFLPKVLTAPSFERFDSASRRAWWEMKPRFESKVAMLNFLFELKDFRDIAKHMISLRSPSLVVDKMRAFRGRLRSIDRTLIRPDTPISVVSRITDTGASAAKIAAQIRLTNEFALKPLISDWTEIMALAGTLIRDAQTKFQEAGEPVQVRHYSESSVLNDTLVPGGDNNYFYAVGLYEKEDFTATLEYKYNYILRSQSDAFLKYWGLNFTPEVIWNAVPMTFLIDYFFKFGKSLHAISVDPNVTTIALQYCESINRWYSHGMSVAGDPRTFMVVNGTYQPPRGTPITGYTGSYYVRRVCSPNKGLPTPRLSLPTGKQGLNMLALATCFLR